MIRDLDFVRAHRNDDVHSLALQAAKYPEVDMPWVVQQVDAWQRARTKLPRWAATEGILFPPHLSMEQCSSESAARYKASVVERWLAKWGEDRPSKERPTTLVDLTGGLGVDHAAMAPLFQRSLFVERQPVLCELALHNFPLLGLEHVEVVEADAEAYVDGLPMVDVVFLDPARRDNHGGRTWGIADCTPNILPLLPKLLQCARMVMVKLSPMLDWHQAVRQLEQAGGHVDEVHIVDVGGECKELLFVVTSRAVDAAPALFCVHDGQCWTMTDEERQVPCAYVADESTLQAVGTLCEPYPCIMKSGCFGMLSHRYGLSAVSPNSHLFVGHAPTGPLPGRMFHVQQVFSLNKKACAEALQGVSHANITTRNFHLTPDQLRKKLRLRDGGDVFLFATTFQRRAVLFKCVKK